MEKLVTTKAVKVVHVPLVTCANSCAVNALMATMPLQSDNIHSWIN